MRILILGGDGYLGWPTAMYLSKHGHAVTALDNFAKRRWEEELGVRPLLPILPLEERTALWHDLTGLSIRPVNADLCDHERISAIIRDLAPEAIVHYGE